MTKRDLLGSELLRHNIEHRRPFCGGQFLIDQFANQDHLRRAGLITSPRFRSSAFHQISKSQQLRDDRPQLRPATIFDDNSARIATKENPKLDTRLGLYAVCYLKR
jgi:hypothetical protein